MILPSTGCPDGIVLDPVVPTDEVELIVVVDDSLGAVAEVFWPWSSVCSMSLSIMSSISGAIRSPIFIPMPPDCEDDVMPLVAVITDKISLKEEIISAVEEDVFLEAAVVPEASPEIDEMGAEMFVIVH